MVLEIHSLQKASNFLVSPKSEDKDNVRKERILNILLLGWFGLGIVASLSNSLIKFIEKEAYDGLSPVIVFSITLIFLALYFFSRAGKTKLVAYIFLLITVLPIYFTSYKWGVNVPLVLLLYGVSVVMAGVLIGSRASFLLMLIHSVFLITLSFVQSTGILNYDSSWKYDLPNIGDGISASAMLAVIVVVSWLSNREIEKALKRARESEKDLKNERDMLETKIDERTKELNRVQLEKVLHLYRLADFGRMAAGFFHDLVNPLTVVSLNLERLQTKGFGATRQGRVHGNAKRLLGRAVDGTKRMDEFVKAVRRQIQQQETKTFFALNKEILQVMKVVEHRAKELQISLSFVSSKKIQTYANPLRFHQLVCNIVLNAIDAYDLPAGRQGKARRRNRKIIIRLSKKNNQAVLVIQDFGCGIAKRKLAKIFDPFFTTKSVEKGTGIGLSICKDIVEKEFKGKVKVKSKEGKGTTFTVKFPIVRKKN